MPPRGHYGYDAPYALLTFAALALLTGIAAALAWSHAAHLARPLTVYFLFSLLNAASFFYTTRHGKFREWQRILDNLALRGDETALDLGCGRGAVLTAVAARLPTGHITGIDLWSTKDQSGNAPAVTLRNASLEGVADRVHIQTADMRSLPFPDATFHLVVSSLAIHNIPSAAGRRQAIREAFRVLKPGGRLVLADIRSTALYATTLRTAGATNITRRRLGWRFWWGNPLAATTLLTASKPL